MLYTGKKSLLQFLSYKYVCEKNMNKIIDVTHFDYI